MRSLSSSFSSKEKNVTLLLPFLLYSFCFSSRTSLSDHKSEEDSDLCDNRESLIARIASSYFDLIRAISKDRSIVLNLNVGRRARRPVKKNGWKNRRTKTTSREPITPAGCSSGAVVIRDIGEKSTGSRNRYKIPCRRTRWKNKMLHGSCRTMRYKISCRHNLLFFWDYWHNLVDHRYKMTLSP